MQNIPSSQVPPKEQSPTVGTPRNEMDGGQEGGHDHKSVVIILGIAVVLVLAAVGFWMYQNGSNVVNPEDGIEARQDEPAPSVDIVGDASEDDTTSVLDGELDSTDLGDLDKEFEDIENELNQL